MSHMSDIENEFEIEFSELDAALQAGTLTGEQLRNAFSVYCDIQYPPTPQSSLRATLSAFYCEGMVDKTELNEYFSRVCQYINDTLINAGLRHDLREGLPVLEMKSSISDMLAGLFSGNLIIFKEHSTSFYIVYISKVPQRALQESNTEISIKGPRDAFTEDLYVNAALIRKRLQTSLLFSEHFTVGSLSKTAVMLIYLKHKANSDMIDDVRQRLQTIKLESLVSSGQLEQWLSDRTFSLFPLFDYIGRPDFVMECLLRGRFVLLIEGSPMVLIGPSNFFELLKSPEDVHFPYYFVMLQRFLRIVALILSMFLPGFWMALATVNLDQIPFTLLSTVVISRAGVPMPSFLEAMVLLFQFELLREAGIRLPKAVGQTIGIVGGIIIGDALIRAGLASPTLLVIIAISFVATFSLVNQSLSGSVGILRIFILIVSSFLGIYGFFLGTFLILIYLCKLDSFGMNYLAPVSTLNFKEFLSAMLADPFKRAKLPSITFKNAIEKKKGK